jgi:hypothetical protein
MEILLWILAIIICALWASKKTLNKKLQKQAFKVKVKIDTYNALNSTEKKKILRLPFKATKYFVNFSSTNEQRFI